MIARYTHRFLATACLILFSGVTPNLYAVSCGDYVVSDVTLTANLHCSSGYTALEVSANGVTIDLNGFTLSGPNSLSGINVIEYDKLTVKNGVIRGFWAGINSTRSDNLNINSVTFYEVDSGVIVSAGNKARISNNDFIKLSSSGVSINARDSLYTASRNEVRVNEFYRVRSGVMICGDQADYNVVADNLFWKTSDRAIDLNRSDRNRIFRNRILETQDGAAIRLNNSSYNQINDNTIREGGHAALSILGDAGSACLNTGRVSSVKNKFYDNHVSDFGTALVLGLGIGTPGRVEGNGLLDNRISDNTTGIYFNSDTRNNYARGNNFTGTLVEIIDRGVGNTH